jgi:2-amino-4-hydroxy-6-hydroxymethyldihydropteridine diphosphokinase
MNGDARHRAYLALGSNLGDRAAYLQHALDELAGRDDVEVVAVSRVYETDPVGGPEQGAYLNAVVAITTTLAPHDLLRAAQAIEASADRVRELRWGPRTLDVDVLLYDDERIDTDDLVVPHPRLRERDFVLVPLRDVAPEEVPVLSGGGSGVRDTGIALRIPSHDLRPPS